MRTDGGQPASVVALCVVLVTTLAISGMSGGAASPHQEENWAGDGDEPMQNYTLHLYDDSSHAPGAESVSIWYEIVVHSLPEDGRRAWLNQSVTASPWVSSCDIGNPEAFVIDRAPPDNGTGGGASQYDRYEKQGNTIDPSQGATWRGEEGIERYLHYLGKDTPANETQSEFPLSTSGWDDGFVQTTLTTYWTKEEASGETPTGGRQSGAMQTFEYQNMDRVVVDFQDCYTNPSEPGWYRQATLAEQYWVDERSTAGPDQSNTEGAPGGVNYAPVTYSHWVYVCDCDSYDAAVQQLGEPPEMNGTRVENPEEFRADYIATPTPRPTCACLTPTETPPPTPTPGTTPRTPTDTPSSATNTPTPSPSPTATPTAAPGPETTRPSTPTPVSQPGFGPLVALVALLAAVLLARRP